MSVVSVWLDIWGDGADGCVPSFSAVLVTTGFVDVDVAGALASGWSYIVEYVGWLLSPLDISYVFGARSTCEFAALLDVKRLYTDNTQTALEQLEYKFSSIAA